MSRTNRSGHVRCSFHHSVRTGETYVGEITREIDDSLLMARHTAFVLDCHLYGLRWRRSTEYALHTHAAGCPADSCRLIRSAHACCDRAKDRRGQLDGRVRTERRAADGAITVGDNPVWRGFFM